MSKFGEKHLERLLETAKQYGLGKPSPSGSVATNWVIFTGTYSAGKTTVVRDVAESLRVRFHEEPARTFIEKQLQQGRTNTEVWANVESTVTPVHKLRVDLEHSLDIEEFVLLDTAIPDTLPYALLYGINPEEIIKASRLFRYKEPILWVEPLPFKSDEIRKSDSKERFALQYLRKKIYITLGYHVVNVPVLDRIKRRNFVLGCLQEIPGKL
ncbi:MAG: AAA family ATPase [Planctomycetota bacterium]|jgi:predicted ATPase